MLSTKVAHRRNESGVTLVELLVVLVLLGVVGSVVMTAVVTSLQASTASTNRVLALNELETGLQRIVRDLRSATVIEPPGTDPGDPDADTFVNMVVYRDGTFNDVTYELVDEQLIRSETDQVLVAFIDNDPLTEPLFTYYDAQGEPVDCNSDCSGARSIEVRLVRGIEGRAPVIVETTASIRNLRYRS